MENFKNLLQVLDYFKEESTCKAFLAHQRWGETPCCPHCGNVGSYVTNRGYKCKAKECHKKFTVITGTVFENTKISLRYWFAAIYLATAHKKGITSLQLSRDLNVTQTTAWFMLHRIREIMTIKAPEKLRGIVEADATYIGGQITKMHKKRRDKLNAIGTGSSTKVGVFGMVERGGNVITELIEKETQKIIHPIIEKNVEPCTLIISDGHGAYKNMKGFNHEVLDHEKGEYVRNHYHTGYIDGFWSQMKRGITGLYHYVSPKHLQRYCHEYEYRYNNRTDKDPVRFVEAFKEVNGKRLTYAKLIS